MEVTRIASVWGNRQSMVRPGSAPRCLAVLLLLSLSVSLAQSYSIDWWTIDGGAQHRGVYAVTAPSVNRTPAAPP